MTVYNTELELENALFEWVATLTNKTVIWANENGPAPQNSYISLEITSPSVAIGLFDENKRVGSQRYLIGQRECNLSIDGFGNACAAEMYELKNLLLTETPEEKLAQLGIVLVESSDVRRIDDTRETKIVRHNQIDVRLRYPIELLNGVDTIETVFIENESSGETTEIPE